MSQPNLKIECDFRDPEKLPNQLVIRGGRVVVAETGEEPVFPERFANGMASEGMGVSIVERGALVKIMNSNRQRRLKLEAIANLTEIYATK